MTVYIMPFVQTNIEEIEDELFIKALERLCKEAEEKDEIKRTVKDRKHTGNQIKGTNLLKIRVPLKQKGKRGGGRVIYYYREKEYIFYIYIYSKSERSDISKALEKELEGLLQVFLDNRHRTTKKRGQI